MSAYFKKIGDALDPTWYATSGAGQFLAAIVKRKPETWTVETGKSNDPVTALTVPSLEAAFDYVNDILSGLVKVK